ncbi:MAG: hypothetical protein LLG06_19350 [Desulfobacteraceae bacterium]|nr:hypothetical protein [Desulfobacteraceae bacterium]
MPQLIAAIPAAISTVGSAVGSAASTAGLMSSTMVPAEAAISASMAGSSIGSWLMPALTVGSMGVSALSSIQQGNMESEIMKANAEASRLEAKSIQESAKAETLRLSREKRQMIGQQATIMGGSGVDLSSGSPLDVMMNTARNFEDDIQQLGYAGDTKAAAKSYEASIYDWAAPMKKRAGWIGAAGTVLSGTASLLRAKNLV